MDSKIITKKHSRAVKLSKKTDIEKNMINQVD